MGSGAGARSGFLRGVCAVLGCAVSAARGGAWRECGGDGTGTGTGLSAKLKELVYIAIDCATTHLYVPGLKLYIRNVVRLGASKEEVMGSL